MKKVLFVNEGYSDNIGDQAINESLISFFKKQNYIVCSKHLSSPYLVEKPNYEYSKSSVDKFSGNWLLKLRLRFKSNLLIKFGLLIKNYAAFFNWYLANVKFIKSFLRNEKFDYIIIGGGQLINSSYRRSPNKFSIQNYTWTKFIPKTSKLIYLGIGVAVNFNKVESVLYKKALNKAEKIWVRDEFSSKVLDEKFEIVSEIIPDMAFYLSEKFEKVKSNKALIGVYSFHEYSVKFGKNNISRSDYYKLWINKVNEYVEKGYEVGLFYTTQTDATETFLFQEHVLQNLEKNLPVCKTNDLKSLNKVLSTTDIIYSGRMHALILGFKHKCIVEAFSVSEKIDSFVKEYVSNGKLAIDYRNVIHESLRNYFTK
jgi:polysaccharide pyruvyl transferase WcaK-like protein